MALQRRRHRGEVFLQSGKYFFTNATTEEHAVSDLRAGTSVLAAYSSMVALTNAAPKEVSLTAEKPILEQRAEEFALFAAELGGEGGSDGRDDPLLRFS